MFVGTAAAAPSFFGYTGLVAIPTADSLGKDEYNLGAFTTNVEEGADFTTYAANMGIVPNLEVGFTRIRPDEASGETWINAKYTFTAETSGNPAIAGGVIDFTDESETTAYIVLSKAFGHSVSTSLGEITTPRFHIGVGGGQFDGVFGGVSATLGDRFTVMAEYNSADVNWGARMALSDELRIHFGGFDGLDDVGLGISFNKYL
jgi:hypothetical protein